MDQEHKKVIGDLSNSYVNYRRMLHVAVGAVIVVVLVAGVVAVNNYVLNNTKKNAAFAINGKYYSKTQIKSLITYPTAHDETIQAAAQEAYTIYKAQAVAKELNIVIPQSQITAQENNITYKNTTSNNNKSASSWLQLVAYYGVLNTELNTGGAGTAAQGYLFNFWFNQHEIYGPAGGAPSGNGNPTLIAQDRSYAQTQANYYHGLLTSNKITPTALISKINSNTKLNQFSVPDNNGSTQFGNSSIQSWEEQLNLNSTEIDYVNQQKKTGISTVMVGQLSVPTSVSSNGLIDSNFYIIELNQLPTSPVKATQFNNSLDSLKTTYYGI